MRHRTVRQDKGNASNGPSVTHPDIWSYALLP